MKIAPVVFGMLLSAAGCFFFTLFDATTKLLVAHYPVFEIMSTQFFISAILVLLFAKATQGKHFIVAISLKKKRWHFARGISQFMSNALIAFSFTHLSLAEFYVILFLAPILVALLAGFFLREKLSFSIIAALIVSFIGVLIALQPQGGFSIWALVAFAGTVANAVTTLFLRKLAETETPISPAYSAGIVVGLLAGVMSLFNFVMPSGNDAALMLLSGAFYAAGQLFFVRAFHYAPAALAAASQFLQLIYGAVVGFLVFNDVPTVWIYIGGAIVIAANLYLLYAQERKGKLRLS